MSVAGAVTADAPTSIVEAFRRVAATNPEHAAIHYHGNATSYRELDARSSALAHHLLDLLGAGAEPVALMCRHGVMHHVSQLAVLKAGKCYSNLDADLLPQRQLLVMDNLEARWLLHDSASTPSAQALAARLPALHLLNVDEVALRKQVSAAPTITITATDVACIVHTSGSTGAPQGVMLTHANVLHLAHIQAQDIGITSADRATQCCPLWTGASVSESYSALLSGATLYPCSLATDGLLQLVRLLTDAAITTLVAAPVMFRLLLQAVPPGHKFSAMRIIRLGGDKVTARDVALLREFFTDHCRLRIGYGSTEFIAATRFTLDGSYQVTGQIPVGVALAGCRIAIVDDDGNEVASGKVGEIVVHSDYLSPGYWRNPVLTAERFPLNANGERCYLTRDLGYLDAAGCLYHMGRKDARVKIYGKLVLVSEIEAALLAMAGISEAVVLAYDTGNDEGTQLAAFVVSREGELEQAAIRQQLRGSLSAEIIPKRWFVLERLPVLPNGKVDRVRLRGMLGKNM